MEVHKAYCSACDREVRVTLKPGSESENPDPSNLVCLDHGTVCTGSLCPLFLVPPPEMKARLEGHIAEQEGRKGQEGSK